LKGFSRQEAEKDATEFLQRLNLTDKKNQMSSALSGGMKRKLSLGIALTGNSKVSSYFQQPLYLMILILNNHEL
jgi:ATP-binding cassette subfamily A (ABC1) protein 3